MKKILLLFAVLASVSTLVLHANGEKTEATSESLDVSDFERKMNSLVVYELIDLRTSNEIALGKIPGAKQIDFYATDFESQIKGLSVNKPVLIYCAVGGRSSKTLQKMKDWGFREVYELAGGFTAWQNAGKKTEK